METIKKIVTATVSTLQETTQLPNETITFATYMTDKDISVNSTIARAFSKIFPNLSFIIEKVSVEIVSHCKQTGNETVLTRFFI